VLTPEARNACTTEAERKSMEAALQEDMEIVNAQHEHHEHLCFLAIDSRPWTTDNGLLTPTLKVRRSLIESRYASRFEVWEAQKKKIIWLEAE
jgi:long-subunit acyl-CoA synthetase (AMP-forming)